jgi:hypothetical protein
MSKMECQAEIRALKESHPLGWRPRFRQLINRIDELDQVLRPLSVGRMECRSIVIADQGPGDDPAGDPLAERVRAVIDCSTKTDTTPNCGGKSKATYGKPLQGHAGIDFDGGGHLTPTVDFAFDEIRDDDGTTELERKVRASEARSAQLETLSRAIQFIEHDVKDDGDIVRRVRLVSHYVRPRRTQAELGKLLGISQSSVASALGRLEREIAGK